jgi:ectoine hydroxylase-related dioxygenase (phytanoyl-CoA dioxygenase family)
LPNGDAVVRVSARDPGWLERVQEAVDVAGCAIVEDVLDAAACADVRSRILDVQSKILTDVGQERLQRAGELGVLRLMAAYDPFFLELLQLPELLQVVDGTVGETAILHLQNGLVLPPTSAPAGTIFQNSFHRDFPRHLNGYLASVNCFLTLDEFTETNGGTIVVPGTQQRAERPSDAYLEELAVTVVCPEGSMLVFDSTLWHAAGENRSERNRIAINHQFTRSFFKQQIDYVRALGDGVVTRCPPRTQQLLGWYTRVVTSLEEYYRPPEERLYRSGQG